MPTLLRNCLNLECDPVHSMGMPPGAFHGQLPICSCNTQVLFYCVSFEEKKNTTVP